MAANKEPIFIATPRVEVTELNSATHGATDAAAQLVFTAGPDGSRIHAICLASRGVTPTNVANLWIEDDVGNKRLIGAKATLDFSGSVGALNPSNNLLDFETMAWIDPAEPFLILQADQKLYVSTSDDPVAAVNTVMVAGGDY